MLLGGGEIVLIKAGYDVVLKPILTKVIDRGTDEAAGQIVDALSNGGRKIARELAIADDGGAGATEALAILEQDPESAAELKTDLEARLDVKLESAFPEADHGTDVWFVAAYEAIFWRVGVLAVWEARPIALRGALQGSDWLTVCVPRTEKVVKPSAMWQAIGNRLCRVANDRPPVEFFVRPVPGAVERDAALKELNERFIRLDHPTFQPDQPETPDEMNAWHRIDGLSRGWVRLRPDRETEDALVNAHVVTLEGATFGRRDLLRKPPDQEEYPPAWRGTLLNIEIGQEHRAISAMIEGVDEFASASAVASAAVEKLLAQSPGPSTD